MYAVVEVNGFQYKVAQGDTFLTNQMVVKNGEEIQIDKVLLLAKDKDVRVGTPYVEGARVSATVIGQERDKKVIAFKYRNRKDSATKKGHRQYLTSLKVTKIS